LNLSDTGGLDPDQLPYFVTDSAGIHVPVRFEPLTSSDISELSGDDWAGAIFLEVWREYAANDKPETLKLVTAEGNLVILGLLNIGKVMDGVRAIKHNLLETAPVYRYRIHSSAPSYRGVGTVLLARLIVESYNLGVGGAVRVRSHPKAEGFYSRIGFTVVHAGRRIYQIPVAQAETVFQKATL